MDMKEANLIVDIEKLRIFLPSFAKIVKLVFDEYKKVGFNDDQALQLTIDYQKSIICDK